MVDKKTVIFFCLMALALSWEVEHISVEEVPCNVTNCASCDDTGTICLRCDKGYYLDDATEACSACNLLIASCAACNISTTGIVTCVACVDKYYVIDEGQACRAC